MRRIVICGAGGHGREVAEILRHQVQQGGELTVVGFVDDNHQLHGQTIDGLPVLGSWSWFEGVDRHEIAVICAVGSPAVCQRLTDRAKSMGLRFANAISPRAYISSFASIGQGVIIFPDTFVSTGVQVDDFCTINVASTISHDTIIGRYTNINPSVHVAGNVRIGEGCYIGMGANIIPGCTLGVWATVGAGAVVIRDLPNDITAVGVPAHVIRYKDKGAHEH